MVRNIDDIADERTRGVQSAGDGYYDTFLFKRPRSEWPPYIDETAKDLSAGIQISDLSLSKDNFGREIGSYYRRGLEKSAGRYADLPTVLEEKVSDQKLGLLAYQLNELSHDITTTTLGIDDVEKATEAVIEKLLTRHVGENLNFSFELTGGTVADVATQLFRNETIASNVDVLLTEFEESASQGLLSLMDEPQMMTPLWDHQREALVQWVEHDNRGYVDMATATGKTVLGLGALALQYGELHPDDNGIASTRTQRDPGRSDDILIVAHSELILEQWRREFDRHLNIPQERTTGNDDITLDWGRVHFRTPQALVNEDRVAYDLVLLDEAHHYATGSEWGSLLDEFDGDVLAMSGSVDDAGSDSKRIKERLSNSIGPEIKRYTITDAKADGVIPSFDWEVHYAPYDIVGGDLQKVARRAERAFTDFQQELNSGEIAIDTERRLRTYEDVRRFSHTRGGNELKQRNEKFRDLVTRLFSRRTKRWNLSPVLDSVVDLVVEHSTTEKVVVLADSNAQVEELESRLGDAVADSTPIYLVSQSQSRTEQRETIDDFDEPESAGVLLGTGDLLGEGVDMQHASVAVNMATGGVNPELVQRIGRVLRNPADTPKHAMFYNVVGTPLSVESAVPREDGKRIIEQAAGFCSLGGRFDKLPGFSTADSLDTDVFGSLLQEGASFIDALDMDGEYKWDDGTVERKNLVALHSAVQSGDGDVDTILGEWEEYAWEHSKDELESSTTKTTENTPEGEKPVGKSAEQSYNETSGAGEETSGSIEIQGLQEEKRKRIADLVRLQPTKNGDLQSRWGFSSGSEVHEYLGSELSEYYFRDGDSLIWATDAAETVVDGDPARLNPEKDTTSVADSELSAGGDEQSGHQPGREDLLDALVTLYESNGRVPTRSDVINEGKYPLKLYGVLFASLDEALKECEGITDKDDLLEEILRLERILGEVPSKAEMTNQGAYAVNQYEQVFGTWSEAVREAGLEPRGSRQRGYTREEVIEGLREVASDLRKTPSVSDINEHATFSASVVYNYFDSLSEANEEAGVTETRRESESNARGETKDVPPTPLAEYYEVFRIFESLLGRIIESDRTSYDPDQDHPMNTWREEIENVVFGSGLDDDSSSYGLQQGQRNSHKMLEYRRAFGDGETITDYQCIETAQLGREDTETLIEKQIISSEEWIHIPVAPESKTRLPIVVSSESELEEASRLLDEFPPEPAPDGQYDSSSKEESGRRMSGQDERTPVAQGEAPDGEVSGRESDSGGTSQVDTAEEQVIFWNRSVEEITEYGDEEDVTSDEGGSAKRDALDKKIDEWKSQLLDLTRRNKLISFKATKTKSLPFEEADPIHLAEKLDGDGELYIRKRPEKGGDEGTRVLARDLDENELLPTRVPDEAQSSLYQIGLKNKQYLRERGVDTLYLSLGMLRWYSVDYSDDANRSPLFLAPVELEEETQKDDQRHDYVLKPKAEGLRLNPALRKKLAAERGIRLPADTALSLKNIDAAFESVYQSLRGFDRWTIREDVVLGIFDFTKFSLYSDLERNRPAIKSNPIIRALNGDTEPLRDAEGDIETPMADELDQVVDPVDMYQVLEADSSQQEAIEAAKRGKSFVLQGPPGTGKSQTIANIITEKLADGDRVLFVSEKQAALDVVKNRLDDVGIGRFCLEVHGEKANNADVLSSLEDELKAGQIKSAENRSQRLRRLRERRDTINEYGEHLFHAPDGWNLTAYQAFGIVSKYMDAPYIDIGIDRPLGIEQRAVAEAIDELETLARFDSEIDTYETSPWRHTTLTQWGVDTGNSMRRSLDQQVESIDELIETASELDSALGIRPQSLAEFRDVESLLQHLSNVPSITWQEAFFDDSFTQENGRLAELAELEQEREELIDTLSESYQRSFFSANGAEFNTELAGYGALKILKPSYRSLKRQITNHAQEGYDPGHEQLLEDTRKLAETQRIEELREDYHGVIQRLGPLYEGSDTDWEVLAQAQTWVAQLANFRSSHTVPIIEVLVDRSLPEIEPLTAQMQEVLRRYDRAASFFESAMAVDEMSVHDQEFRRAPLTDLTRTLEDLRNEIPDLQRRVQFYSQLTDVRETISEAYIDRFLDSDYGGDQLVPAFKKRFYTKWLNDVYEHTGLGSFNADEMERYLEEFRRLDEEQQELAKIEIQHEVTRRRPSLSLKHASSSEQVLVRRETEKQRRHKPLRELFDEAGSFITGLTPCFMMSPLSVAQYLKADSIQFDTVVFDEASQIMPQDAISSLIRAEQAIIAGDTKQLPPTSFFQSDIETTEDVREDLDSILEETASVLPEKHLRWHYRSRTKELIEFSNYHYYNNSLRTFPENGSDVETGVSFEYVSDGIYDRGGSRQNENEAQRVIDLIEEHAEKHSEKSLGVVAFSSAQEQAIRDSLEERCEESAILDAFVSQDDVLDEFFIKNLEMVQGDERDRMIFSVGYGPDQDGIISMNFGPLNKSGGERRLNVAVTRAKEQITVVSSIRPAEIDLTRTNSTGVAHFKNYLEYAQKGEQALARDDTVTNTLDFDSQFEEAVYTALEEEGYDVVPQVQSSNYSIDLAVKHPERPGEFVLGIECDGAAYHSSKTARDRDRTRQIVLENLGWTIHRIWSPDWTSNREREVQKIDKKVESLISGESFSPETEDIPSYEPETITVESKTDHEKITELQEPSLTPDTRYSPNTQDQRQAVRNSLEDIVVRFGPIERESAFRAALDVWSESRLGKNVRRTFESVATDLKRSGKLFEKDGFLWPSLEQLDFKIRVNTDRNERSIEEIPVEEIAMAEALLLSEGGQMTRDDLELETARLLGYQRRGQRVQTRLQEAMTFLEENGFIDSGDRITLNPVGSPQSAILKPIYPTFGPTEDTGDTGGEIPERNARSGTSGAKSASDTKSSPREDESGSTTVDSTGTDDAGDGFPESDREKLLLELFENHLQRDNPANHWIDLTFDIEGNSDAVYQYLDGAHNLTGLTPSLNEKLEAAVDRHDLSIVSQADHYATLTNGSVQPDTEVTLCIDLLKSVYGVSLDDIEQAGEHEDGYEAW